MKQVTAFVTPTRGNLMTTHCLRVLLVLAAAAGSPAALAQDSNGNPGVVPPNAHIRGLSYGEWEARWWQTLFSIPVVDGYHPGISGGAFGGEDGVVFLTGVPGGPTIHVTIRPGTALFFPVVNAECSEIEPDPYHGDNEQELRACANMHIDNTSGLFAVIDGRPVKNLGAYRVQSPLFEFGPLPEDNLLAFAYGDDADFPPGATSLSVDAGVYLLLAPLSVGKHTIHFGATLIGGAPDGSDLMIDTTYIVTVVP
jgi:hypothetical protein